MSSQPLSRDRQLPLPARATVSLENDSRLDGAVKTMTEVMAPLDDSPTGDALRGTWLGHALHPVLTDLPLGMFTATSVLDVFGGAGSRDAAQRLLGVGLLGAAPTAVTGWAEWTRAERPAQRVGVAHAALNVAAIALYAGSWAARRGGRHRFGAVLATGGAGFLSAAAYLGGHLTTVRKVSSRHPAFDAAAAAPEGASSAAG
jgi:uncharacterized membrane protein